MSIGNVLVSLVTWWHYGGWRMVHCFSLPITLSARCPISCLPWWWFPLFGKNYAFQLHARPCSRYWRDKGIDLFYGEDYHLPPFCLFLSLYFKFLHIIRRFAHSLYISLPDFSVFLFQVFLNFKFHVYSYLHINMSFIDSLIF